MQPVAAAKREACAGVFSGGDGATGAAVDDFARGDNPFSVAVWTRLEFHAEVGLHELVLDGPYIIAKH